MSTGKLPQKTVPPKPEEDSYSFPDIQQRMYEQLIRQAELASPPAQAGATATEMAARKQQWMKQTKLSQNYGIGQGIGQGMSGAANAIPKPPKPKRTEGERLLKEAVLQAELDIAESRHKWLIRLVILIAIFAGAGWFAFIAYYTNMI
jgi:hypothetical protein